MHQCSCFTPLWGINAVLISDIYLMEPSYSALSSKGFCLLTQHCLFCIWLLGSCTLPCSICHGLLFAFLSSVTQLQHHQCVLNHLFVHDKG